MANGEVKYPDLPADFELTFDSENHGRNIRVVEDGHEAEKVKK